MAKAKWVQVRTDEGFVLRLVAGNGTAVMQGRPRQTRGMALQQLGVVLQASAGLARMGPARMAKEVPFKDERTTGQKDRYGVPVGLYAVPDEERATS